MQLLAHTLRTVSLCQQSLLPCLNIAACSGSLVSFADHDPSISLGERSEDQLHQPCNPSTSYARAQLGTEAASAAGHVWPVRHLLGRNIGAESVASAWSTLQPLPAQVRQYAHIPSMATKEQRKQISKDSLWLEHYRKDISPRQLTFRISKRSKLQDLQDAMVLYEHRMDTIASAAFLKQLRVSMRRDPDFSNATAEQLFSKCVTKVTQPVMIKYANLSTITSFLYALARLRSSSLPSSSSAKQETPLQFGVSDEVIVRMVAKATIKRETMLHAPPRTLATLLWSLAELLPQHQHDPIVQHALDKIALCTVKRLQNFNFVELAVLCDAYTRMGPLLSSSAQALQEAAQAAAAKQQQAAPSTSSTTASSASGSEKSASSNSSSSNSSSTQAGAAAAASGNQEEVLSLSRGFTLKHMSERTPPLDLPASQKRNRVILEAVAKEIVTRSGHLAYPQPRPRQLAMLASAFAAHGFVVASTLSAIATSAAEQKAAFKPLDMVQLMQAFAMLGVREQQLLQAAQGHLKQAGLYGQQQSKALTQALSSLGEQLDTDTSAATS